MLIGTSKNAKISTWCTKKRYFNQKVCYVCKKKCVETEFGVIIEHVTKSNRGQYKSINHIKNMLKCLPAKEWRDVPDEILNIVKMIYEKCVQCQLYS